MVFGVLLDEDIRSKVLGSSSPFQGFSLMIATLGFQQFDRLFISIVIDSNC